MLSKGGDSIKRDTAEKETEEYQNSNALESGDGKDVSFKEHHAIYRSNGLSFLESAINAAASRLVHKDKKFSKSFADAFFGIVKRLSAFYETLEKRRKNSAIVRRYVARCDSLVKKAGFMLSVLKEPIKLVAVLAVVTFSLATMINSASYDVVLGVYTDGALVGYLDTRAPMTNALTALESDLSSIVKSDYTVDCKIDYSFLNVKEPTLLNDADCYRILYNIASEDLTDAYALYVDDKLIASCTDFDTLNSLVKQLGDGSVSVKNDIRIANQLCLKTSVRSAKEIASLLEIELEENEKEQETAQLNLRVEAADEPTGSASTEPSVLETGIPRFSNGVTSLIMPSTLSDGTKITTDKDELLKELDLVYVKNETVVEAVPYDITYIESDDYYVGTQMLKTGGREGSAEVVYEIEYDKNGEISRTAVSKKVIKEPVTEVMVIGTSQVPTVNPSGSFVWPTDVPKGISSYYGGRKLFGSYDFHLGIDILNSYGNDIWAADSGEVTYAGYNNSYGYYVTIDHGDGFSTLYAHMSKLYVETGDIVKQNDVIGAIGKTGVATAYHLHFEVRIDGKTVDPLSYLPRRDQ